MSPASVNKIVYGVLNLTLSVGVVHGALKIGNFPSLPVLDAEGGPEYTYHTTFDHEEPYGPSEWQDGYPDCGGIRQSPINLSAADEETVEASVYNLQLYAASCSSDELHFEVDDHFYKVDYSSCVEAPSLSFGGYDYDLLQLHVHSVSEHRIGSTHHDAEVHLVHLRRDSETHLLVLGVLIDAAEYGDNKQISQLWSVLNVGKSTSTEDVFVSSPYDMIPSTPTYIHYIGSLTTPPCTEGVKWLVFAEPTLMSDLQLQEYRYHVSLVDHTKVNEHGNTNRPDQPLNGRKIKYVSY